MERQRSILSHPKPTIYAFNRFSIFCTTLASARECKFMISFDYSPICRGVNVRLYIVEAWLLALAYTYGNSKSARVPLIRSHTC